MTGYPFADFDALAVRLRALGNAVITVGKRPWNRTPERSGAAATKPCAANVSD
jgi:hypothetical protein